MSGPNSPKRPSLVASAVLAVTFLLGGATGAGVTFWALRAQRPELPPGPLPLFELDLTKGQRAEVQEIFERYHPEFDAVFRSTFPKVQAISQDLEKEVREVLTPEQRVRLDELRRDRPGLPPKAGPWGPPGHPPTGHGPAGGPPGPPPFRPPPE